MTFECISFLRLELQHSTNELVKVTNDQLKQLRNLPTPDKMAEKQCKIFRDRLMKQFSEVLQDFQSLQKEITSANKSRLSFLSSTSSSDNHPIVPTSSSQSSWSRMEKMGPTNASTDARDSSTGQGYQNQSQIQVEENSVKEMKRQEEAMKQIERDMVDVNQVFTELALLVGDQGTAVDSIDSNIATALNNVEEGRVQVEQASKYQTKARKKCMCLIVILVVVAVVVGLLIYFLA